MKFRSVIAFVVGTVAFFASAVHAQTREEIPLGYQWKGREILDDVWRIHHSGYNDVAILVYADRRTGVPLLEAFEHTKKERAKIDKCPALGNAESVPKHELFGAAMAALEKIDDDPNNDDSINNVPIIGYEAVDSEANPRCALIARELAGGTMLYTVVTHLKGEVIENYYQIPKKAHRLMDTLNERAIAAIKKAEMAAKKKEPSECGGEVAYKHWVMAWSPKLGTLYARNLEFLDKAVANGKVARIGIMVRTKHDAKGVALETTHSLYMAAKGDGEEFIPQKQRLTVDGKIAQEWGDGFHQWAGLTPAAMNALYTGKTAEIKTKELGRIRFTLQDMKESLELLDTNQQIATLTNRLEKCPE
ncbi:hypothetical protein [Hyphococcus lacteus]|uniref:Uncharacterized protein n=1 Tax=Hyphococcus lacteus TaxID=3143536 RepID=A0ABV3Z8Z2_9PROT